MEKQPAPCVFSRNSLFFPSLFLYPWLLVFLVMLGLSYLHLSLTWSSRCAWAPNDAWYARPSSWWVRPWGSKCGLSRFGRTERSFGRTREERGPFVLKMNDAASSGELSRGREKHQEGQCMRRVPVGETHIDVFLWFMGCVGVVFFLNSDHEVYVGWEGQTDSKSASCLVSAHPYVWVCISIFLACLGLSFFWFF